VTTKAVCIQPKVELVSCIDYTSGAAEEEFARDR